MCMVKIREAEMNRIENYGLSNQTSFGMKKSLKTVEILQRKAKNVYPHISPYEFEQRLYRQNENISTPLQKVLTRIQIKLDALRLKMGQSKYPQKELIENMKQNKIGNGGEEVNLATIIGKLNGQKNIFSGRINGLDHGVAFITGKIVKNGEILFLKNKDAIIIDPQLGITDYAGNYYTKLKEIMGEQYKRQAKYNAGLCIIPRDNHSIKEITITDLKTNYPELLIKDYKPVQM